MIAYLYFILYFKSGALFEWRIGIMTIERLRTLNQWSDCGGCVHMSLVNCCCSCCTFNAELATWATFTCYAALIRYFNFRR